MIIGGEEIEAARQRLGDREDVMEIGRNTRLAAGESPDDGRLAVLVKAHPDEHAARMIVAGDLPAGCHIAEIRKLWD